MDTNRHEDRWTSLNDKRHQNASAILCPWCDFVSLVDDPRAVKAAALTTSHCLFVSDLWLDLLNGKNIDR